MANVKINDLLSAAVNNSMQLETDIGGIQSNKITIADLSAYIVSLVPPSSGIIWNNTNSTTTIAASNGYKVNSVSLVDLNLPLTMPENSFFRVVNLGSGGFRINQNSGQTIRFGNQTTTTGVGGSCTSIDIGDSIEVLCTIADTEFVILSAVGNINLN